MNFPELVLGTVQFGLKYGVSNRQGKVDEAEAEKILDLSFANGIRVLDTAIAYGDSESILGKLNQGRFEVVTKLPSIPKNCSSPGSWTTDSIKESFERLRIQKLKGLLLHDPSILSSQFGREVYSRIRDFIDEGKIEKFGISIYSYRDLELIPDFVSYDIIQTPMNVFDRKFLTSGWLEKMNTDGILIQVRSIFLQGLLLMESSNRPQYFFPWNKHLEQWDKWLQDNKIEPLEACIKYIQSIQGISQIVFGVESVFHLREILSFCQKKNEILFPNYLASEDEGLINPSLWKLT
ncbi:aldo/keto reductase [Leptospira yasudae]|uniref:aldo/keto reductase n=1 Tax=Leptospira yasudae TaxID=2202201 RepID=UPI000E59BF91|nr:aldo/keto reductase [Leptospira yasudae]RHX91164.1 aldo/keto reductase [Leptospira yasudae]